MRPSTTAFDKKKHTPEAGAAPTQAVAAGVTLITEQQVLFGAAAQARPRADRRGRIGAMLKGWISTLTMPPRPPYLSRNAYYFERARMGREMDRL